MVPSQGFAHRDIKPHNFVLRSPGARLLLIDFGSAAPLMQPANDGSQNLEREHCLVPCGTCDYISPEILQAHENALVALEFSDEEIRAESDDEDIWGTHQAQKLWLSMVGDGLVEPWRYVVRVGLRSCAVFAKDIRQTYARIMKHEYM